ncbi:2',5'-phosphodiesterase 12 isoform X2 [Calliopsis andreniformis]
MNEVLLRYDEGNESFEASFRYVNPNLKVDKQFNFNRKVDEPINNFLRRMDANISHCARKKLKKKNMRNVESLSDTVDNVNNKMIKFMKNDSIIDGDVTCRSILEDTSNIKLVIFDTEYVLKRNVPCIKKIQLPSSILVGFPTYPSVFESVHVDRDKTTFQWFKNDNKNKWVHVGDGYLYIPDVSDLGCKLKIACTPRNSAGKGPMIEVISNNKVEAGPGVCPFETRHVFTSRKLSGKSFRVTSYNILANVYSETELSKDVLYPYCPEYALSMDYRKLLILKELMGYNSDIICLQEVDLKVYENDLVPSLYTLNYNSVYNLKNDLREGLAIFYDRERFNELGSSATVIGLNTDFTEFNSVWSQIQSESVKETFKNRSTIIQSIILESKETSEILIVGNTHLYFRPEADHIRLLQAYYGLTYLQKIFKEIQQKYPERNVSIIYCGDFNSSPENGVYQLMTQKYIPEDYADWKSSPNEHVENIFLKHDFNLSSACGTPEYTNYTGGFAGCLDYIFYQTDRLEVEQVIPMPSKEELSLYTGLPSVVFPSDHISLCADLKWSK